MGKITGLVFETSDQLDIETFVCQICGKEYKTKKGLEDHMVKEHKE